MTCTNFSDKKRVTVSTCFKEIENKRLGFAVRRAPGEGVQTHEEKGVFNKKSMSKTFNSDGNGSVETGVMKNGASLFSLLNAEKTLFFRLKQRIGFLLNKHKPCWFERFEPHRQNKKKFPFYFK